jgi:polysaccharide biosynthesis transport protein
MREPVPATSPGVETPGLVRAARTVSRRWWVLPLCAFVSFLVALVLVERAPKQYTATAKMQFTTNTLPSQVAGVQENQSLDPEGDKATNVQLVTTTPVAELVIKALGLHTTTESLLGHVSASNPQNAYIVDVAVVDENPHEAARIANAFAEQYVLYSQRQNEAQLVKGEQLIEQKIAALPATDSVDRANLQTLNQKLLLLQAVQTGNATVVNTANVPSEPTSPKKKEIVAVALILGLALGLGLVFLLDLIDRHVKTWEEFEELYGIPALAGIPSLPRQPRSSREREIALEPFRILRNGLSVLAPPEETKTVLVTSAVSGEGKTTIAIGLARAAALSGLRVILVEADLRRPSFSRHLSLDERQPGLTSVLYEGKDPLELLCTPIAGLDNLRVLPGGPVEEIDLNLARFQGLTEIFASLGTEADLVVIDSAPLLPVVDTRALLDAPIIDACLVVARAGVTTREEVRRVRALVSQRSQDTVGLVINMLSDVGGDYYYGYGENSAGASSQHGENAPRSATPIS